MSTTGGKGPTPTPTWLGSAGYWLVAFLICAGLGTVIANLAALVLAQLAQPTNADAIHSFGLSLRLAVTNILATHVVVSLLLGFFSQTTALLILRSKMPFRHLYFTLLTLFSAILAFFIFFPSAKEIVRTSGLDLEIQVQATLALILAGFYIAHVIILLAARRLARRGVAAPLSA